MKFAVVAIECTGGTFGSERVIDVGIFVLEKGEVVDQLGSHVHPEKGIHPYVTKLTGITK